MKFLCDNCKAKYQIPDQKIAGRTLRMKCRKCGHNIIIRGPKVESPIPARQSRRPASGRPRRGGSHAGPRPASRKSAIGAEFRRSAASVAPPPESSRPVAEWYVAINDVPVGPIKREEVARKIGTGAVTEGSLCWREGFDDWLPVSQVPELLALMKQRRVPKPPPRSAPAPAPPKAPPPAPSKPPRSNVVPIGGRLGAAAAPTIEEVAPTPAIAPTPSPIPAPAASAPPAPQPAPQPASEPTPIPPPGAVPDEDPFVVPPAAASATATSGGPAVAAEPRRLPVGAWIAIVGAGCFGIAFAVVLANKLLQEDPAPLAQNDPVVQDTTNDSVEPELDLTEPVVEDPVVEDPVEDVEDPVEDVEDPGTSTTTMRRTTTTTAMNEPELTEAQRRQLAQLQMSSGTEGTPGNIAVMMTTSTNMRAALDENAVRRVVQANQRGLQSCYNRAIRGLPDPPDSRLTVNVTVGASGSVTRLSVTGQDFGGLKSCVTSQVRRWRFPPSSGSQQTRFPLVFTAPG